VRGAIDVTLLSFDYITGSAVRGSMNAGSHRTLRAILVRGLFKASIPGTTWTGSGLCSLTAA
jgi:hypothetical protein